MGTQGGGLGDGREFSAAVGGGVPLRLRGQRQGRRPMGVPAGCGGDLRCALACSSPYMRSDKDGQMKGLAAACYTSAWDGQSALDSAACCWSDGLPLPGSLHYGEHMHWRRSTCCWTTSAVMRCGLEALAVAGFGGRVSAMLICLLRSTSDNVGPRPMSMSRALSGEVVVGSVALRHRYWFSMTTPACGGGLADLVVDFVLRCKLWTMT